MRIRIAPPGLIVDGEGFACSVRFRVLGGDLRYDEQDEQGADDMPTSRIILYFSGWHKRSVALTLMSSPPLGAGPGIEQYIDHLARLFAGSRGTEPQRHSLLGPLPAALGMDSPFIIESFRPDWNDETDEMEIEILLIEEDPEIVSLTTDPPPVSPDPAPDDVPEPDASLSADERTLIEQFEELDFGPQPEPE